MALFVVWRYFSSIINTTGIHCLPATIHDPAIVQIGHCHIVQSAHGQHNNVRILQDTNILC